MLRRAVKWISVSLVGLLVAALAIVGVMVVQYNRAAEHVFDVPPMALTASTDSAILARGEHIALSFGGCTGCHGPGLGGGEPEEFGPLGVLVATNLTRGAGGVGNNYSDGELARAVRTAIGSNGRSLRFMPSQEYHWLPDADLLALVSYVRSVDPVDNVPAPSHIGVMGKVLDRAGVVPFLTAYTTAKLPPAEEVPAPEPTARYGAFLATGCKGCHGATLSGGPIPGAPSSLPIPRNLTMHETGLKAWTEADFVIALNTGVRPDGTTINAFMPLASFKNLDTMEKRALWEYLRSIEPKPFGQH